jgi:sterol desaturase/sphingolipid hydroxylase (fatty acid hydroxylase superfamily)
MASETLLRVSSALHSITSHIWLPLIFAAVSFGFVFVCEHFDGVRTGRYKSRSFVHDMIWWFYYASGIHTLLFMGVIYAVLGRYLAVFQLHLLEPWPSWARYLAYFIVVDFAAYWYHRWKHASRFLWAFHSMHHAQEELTPPTIVRGHPVEQIIGAVIIYIPLQIMGAAPALWYPILLVRHTLEWTQHSELSWKLGPLYWIVVSPKFHAFHHSVSPAHHNRNFGTNLAVWDFLFGTWVEEPERPRLYGLAELKMPTLLSQVLTPLRLAWEVWFGERGNGRSAGASVAPVPDQGDWNAGMSTLPSSPARRPLE